MKKGEKRRRRKNEGVKGFLIPVKMMDDLSDFQLRCSGFLILDSRFTTFNMRRMSLAAVFGCTPLFEYLYYHVTNCHIVSHNFCSLVLGFWLIVDDLMAGF